MSSYDHLEARQIYALVPIGVPPVNPPEAWYQCPWRRVRAELRLGGDLRDLNAALDRYSRDQAAIRAPGSPLQWIQTQWNLGWLPYRFQWGPRMSWPQIYEYVTEFYQRYPDKDVWKDSGVPRRGTPCRGQICRDLLRDYDPHDLAGIEVVLPGEIVADPKAPTETLVRKPKGAKELTTAVIARHFNETPRPLW